MKPKLFTSALTVFFFLLCPLLIVPESQGAKKKNSSTCGVPPASQVLFARVRVLVAGLGHEGNKKADMIGLVHLLLGVVPVVERLHLLQAHDIRLVVQELLAQDAPAVRPR